MTPELAKQLKDAGFPFKTTNFAPNEKVEEAFFLDEPYGLGYLPPTLSELIEACGNVSLLVKDSKAKASNYELEIANKYFYADTPEEAVAKLWLALKGIPNGERVVQ